MEALRDKKKKQQAKKNAKEDTWKLVLMYDAKIVSIPCSFLLTHRQFSIS